MPGERLSPDTEPTQYRTAAFFGLAAVLLGCLLATWIDDPGVSLGQWLGGSLLWLATLGLCALFVDRVSEKLGRHQRPRLLSRGVQG